MQLSLQKVIPFPFSGTWAFLEQTWAFLEHVNWGFFQNVHGVHAVWGFFWNILIFSCFWSTTRLMLRKVELEKKCQQAKAKQSHSNNHPVRHGKVGVKKELLARVVLSLSTTVVLLYCVAAVENTFSFVGRSLAKLNNKSSTVSDLLFCCRIILRFTCGRPAKGHLAIIKIPLGRYFLFGNPGFINC